MSNKRSSLVVLTAFLALAAGCGGRVDLPLGADVGAGASVETGVGAGAGAGSGGDTVACPASPELSVTLFIRILDSKPPQNSTLLPGAMTITGDAVFWSTTAASQPPMPEASGAIRRSALGDGTDTDFLSLFLGNEVYDEGPIVHDGNYLYFPNRAPKASRAFPNVAAKRLDGGDILQIPNPPLDGGVVRAIATNDGKGVYWLLGNVDSSDSTLLAYWDGATTTTVATIPAYAFDLVVSHDTAFFLGNTEPLHPTAQTLYQVPLSGGAPLALQSIPADAAFLGSNRKALFFSTLANAGTIVRHDFGSNVEATLTTGSMMVLSSSDARPVAFVDDAWVYYGRSHQDASADGNLWRLSVDGGMAEMISTDPSQTIGAVAASACNIYWLGQPASDPKRVDLMVRPKN